MNKSLRRRGIAIASAVAMSVTGVTVASTAIAPAAWALEAFNGEASNYIIDQGVGVLAEPVFKGAADLSCRFSQQVYFQNKRGDENGHRAENSPDPDFHVILCPSF